MGEVLNSIPPGLWAVIGTIIGSIGLKIVERWLSANADKRADRADYREEIASLNSRLDDAEADVDKWRARAFKMEEQVSRLRAFIFSIGKEPPNYD